MTVRNLTRGCFAAIGVLLLAVGFAEFIKRGHGHPIESFAKNTIANMDLGVEQFKVDFGRYPTTEEGIKVLLVATSDSRGSFGPYVKKANDFDPWEHPYVYKFPGIHNPGRFDIYSLGPDGKEGGGDDIGNWSNDGK